MKNSSLIRDLFSYRTSGDGLFMCLTPSVLWRLKAGARAVEAASWRSQFLPGQPHQSLGHTSFFRPKPTESPKRWSKRIYRLRKKTTLRPSSRTSLVETVDYLYNSLKDQTRIPFVILLALLVHPHPPCPRPPFAPSPALRSASASACSTTCELVGSGSSCRWFSSESLRIRGATDLPPRPLRRRECLWAKTCFLLSCL